MRITIKSAAGDSPFVRNLISSRHIKADELSMGISATSNTRVIDREGTPSDIVLP